MLRRSSRSGGKPELTEPPWHLDLHGTNTKEPGRPYFLAIATCSTLHAIDEDKSKQHMRDVTGARSTLSQTPDLGRRGDLR
jgi:hypothetical protein